MPISVRFIGCKEPTTIELLPEEEERFDAAWREYILDRNKPRGGMFRGAVAGSDVTDEDYEYGLSVNFDAVAMVSVDRPKRSIKMDFW